VRSERRMGRVGVWVSEGSRLGSMVRSGGLCGSVFGIGGEDEGISTARLGKTEGGDDGWSCCWYGKMVSWKVTSRLMMNSWESKSKILYPL